MSDLRARLWFVVGLFVVSWLAAACSASGSLQAMANQPRYDPYESSNFFPDGSSSRPVVSGTVPYGQPAASSLLVTGKANGQDATTYPFPITAQVMARGQQRYNIYCAPCHGLAGNGDGIVAQRGFCCVASLNTKDLRDAPPGHLFDMITNGVGAMPSYGFEILPRDRWAIIAYVRALQFSQNATLPDVPPEQQNQLESATPAP